MSNSEGERQGKELCGTCLIRLEFAFEEVCSRDARLVDVCDCSLLGKVMLFCGRVLLEILESGSLEKGSCQVNLPRGHR